MTIFKKLECEEQPCVLWAVHAAVVSSSATVLPQSPTAAWLPAKNAALRLLMITFPIDKDAFFWFCCLYRKW